MKLSKKGMSLVEIIVSIALISIVLVFLMGLFVNVRKTYLTSRNDSKYEMNIAKVVKAIGDDIENYGLYCMKQIETDPSDISYVLIYNQSRSSNPFDRVKKVLELKENADTKDLYTGEAKKINYISYGYDERYINNFTAQEMVSKVTSEIPDTAIIGKSLGYENSIIINTQKTSENKNIIEIKIPIENDVGTDYGINIVGVAAKENYECSDEDLVPITSYKLTFDSKGGKPKESSKLIAKGFAYGTLPKPVYSGYKFLGWFTSETGGTQVTEETLVDTEGDKTLYAHWEVNSSGGETSGGGTLTVNQVLEKLNITPNNGTPNFAQAATTDEGVYAMEDDYGTSYYYRGAVTNNYVKFAGFYWRIVRINGDGSLRIEYDGSKMAYANGTSDTDRVISNFITNNKAFNLTKDSNNNNVPGNKHAGYMYARYPSTTKESTQKNELDSTLKSTLDTWYETNLKGSIYEKYISDTLFCNDRSTASSNASWYTKDTALGYGTNLTVYGGFSRFYTTGYYINQTNPSPTLKCPQKNDRFTVDDKDIGNGDLTYPIGAMTADELSIAGLVVGNSSSYGNPNSYLTKGSWFFTMTPLMYNTASTAGMYVFYNNGYGYINRSLSSSSNGGVVPVINLSTEFVRDMIGDGSKDSPYQLNDPNESKSKSTLEKMSLTSKGRLYNFASVATTNLGVYESNDNYGVSYYFRGAVTNNYVKFAGFYWRIIRINGDGTLRVMYNGTSAYSNVSADTDKVVTVTDASYNKNADDAKYVGYMYGPAGTAASTSKKEAQENLEDSNFKKNLDSWYEDRLYNKPEEKYISDTLFCNDRSTASKSRYWWSSYDTTLGYGTNKTAYGAWRRIRTTSNTYNTTDPMPSFMCWQKNDCFTANDTEVGNGALIHPIGTFTIDEVMAAGAVSSAENKSFYMYNGRNLNTMTASLSFNASVYKLLSTGKISSSVVSTAGIYIVPVINLSTEFVNQMIGTGTSTDPFRLS